MLDKYWVLGEYDIGVVFDVNIKTEYLQLFCPSAYFRPFQGKFCPGHLFKNYIGVIINKAKLN